jgi:3-hydroxybutyryl-CoA dehydratase
MPAFTELRVGMTAASSRTVTETDIVLFAGITGDMNPVHLDEVAAERSLFGGRIAHGMLTAGYVSATLGMKLPGPGAIYVEQTLRFTRPVRPGDTVTAAVEILEIDAETRRVRLRTTCANQDGKTVLDGEAVVLIPEETS